jgi:phosphoglycolate phosphatase-like HAD superfamily hydrolase
VALLVLFDVDGTLFLTHDPLATEALRGSLQERFDVRLPDDAMERVEYQGQTSLRIARLILEVAAFDDATIDAGLAEWCRRFAERYVELLGQADTSGWRAAPGAEGVLAKLADADHQLALLTGNPEPMARARMERLGLADFFPSGQGGFGCDAEERAELIELARARAGNWPRDRTVEIGDTARDTSSAHEAGIRSIRVDGAGLAAVVPQLLA